MTREEFHEELIEDLRVSAEYNQSDPYSEFVITAVENLTDAEEIEDVEIGYFEGTGRRNSKMIMDGYSFDLVDKSCVVIISDFINEATEETLTNSDIDRLYTSMRRLIEFSLDGYILENDFEESSIGYTFASELERRFNNGEISKFRFYILTNKNLSTRVKNIKKEHIFRKPVELNAWDINRFYSLYTAGQAKEDIEIDTSNIEGGGLAYVKATEAEDYSSYLAVLPGQFLADIYLDYGSRLLEGNVRSFLSIRGKVNKAIRGTILHQPDRFFAYNNGIAATATKIDTEVVNGINVITSIKDMQIINGGQTTASIANAVLKDKADLSNIHVPMKLSVLDYDKAREMIPEISRSSNSQNKVDEADFFSNHPYHIRIEELSRKTLAPTADGNQYQTAWFYERARGQYVQEQMKLTSSERRKFQIKHPKSQLIKKVDIAKYVNSYDKLPHTVSRGAQFNMRNFAESINKKWKPDEQDTFYNDAYYKKLIALAILFKSTEKIVSGQQWYQEIKAYRANIVTYTIAVIINNIDSKYPGKDLDFSRIWQNQKISNELENQIIITSKEVFDFITDESRETLNVTEWCKKDACWEKAKKYDFTLNDSIKNTLVNKNEIIEEIRVAKKEQKENNELKDELQIYELGDAYWQKVLEFGMRDGLLTPMEISLLNVAANIEKTGRPPSDKQTKLIMLTRKRLINEGMPRDLS